MTKKYKEIIESVECDICHKEITGKNYVEISALVCCNEDLSPSMHKGTVLHSRGCIELCKDCYIKLKGYEPLIRTLDTDTME